MAEKYLIYVKDDMVNEMFAPEDNKSRLVVDLLRDYYSENDDKLKEQIEIKESELDRLKKKLNAKQLDKLKEEEIMKEESKIKEKKLEREELIEQWNFLYNGDKITQEEYWDAYNEEEKMFDLEILRTKLKEVKI